MVPVSTAHVLPPWTREAPVQRLAFVLRIEEGREAFFEQGASGHAILPNSNRAMREELGQACDNVLRCFLRPLAKLSEFRERSSRAATA